ncbi:chemotaxis protein CheW [Lignipirellula cremea]|nr:chemotaxis protein CheW [Lignipirellula cremea]
MSESSPIDETDLAEFPDPTSVWSRLESSLERLRLQQGKATDPAVIREKLLARAKALRVRMREPGVAEEHVAIIAFEKGGQRYGVLLSEVTEVQTLLHYCPTPMSPGFIPGVVHWRGGIIALLDAGLFLGQARSGLADVHVYLLVEAAGRRMGLVANEIEDILSIPRSQILPAPRLPGEIISEAILGVYDQNLLILKMDKILGDKRLTQWRNESLH